MVKRKILFRIGNLEGGGAEKVLSTILKNFDRTKFKVDILLHQLSGIYVKDIPNDVGLYYLGKGEAYLGNSWVPKGIERKIEKKKYKWLKGNNWYIYTYLLKDSYDVEVAFLHDLMPLVTNSPTPKKVGWVHNDLSHKDYLTKQIREEIIKKSSFYDEIVCVSQQAKNSFIAMGGDEKSTRVIYNPIDRQEILTKAQAPSIVLDKSVINLVAIGRLHGQKRYDRLLESLKILKDKGITNFHLNILGTGEIKPELLKLTYDYQLDEFVSFLGFVENPYAILNQSDVYVLSSDFEGFSLTVAESMVLCKTIVSTKVTGPEELLKNGEFGVLVDKNVEDLSTALERVINDENYRQSFEDKLKNMEMPFEMEFCMKQIEDLLLNL